MADDLFGWLDSLWTKKQPTGTPPIYVMHRFLASDRHLANAARVLRQEVREPDLIAHTWRGLLPKGPRAPRLTYVAAKKAPAAEELTTRMMANLGVRRAVAEEMQQVVELRGELADLYRCYGVKPPKEVTG